MKNLFKNDDSNLTLIYFLGHAQPRNISISVRRLRQVLIACSLLVIWIGVSIVLVPMLAMENRDYKNLLEVKNLSLELEVEKNRLLVDRLERDVDLEQELDKETENALANTMSAKSIAAKSEKETIATEAIKVTAAQPQSLTVQDFTAKSKHNQLKISFLQTNRKQNSTAKGKYWAVGEFKTEAGKSIFVSYPQGIIDENGETKNPQLGKKYSLRNLKKRLITLQVPKDLDGNFCSVRLGFKSDEGIANSLSYSLDRLSLK